jgi:uncharacterized protein involved in type VI secretion and phage assembly
VVSVPRSGTTATVASTATEPPHANYPPHARARSIASRVSSPFEYVVDVASPAEFDPETLLGEPALLTIRALEEPRLIHGLVSAAEYIGHTRHLELYQLTITPFAHRLLHRRPAASSRT